MGTIAKLRAATNLEDFAHLVGYAPKGLSYLLYKLPSTEKYTTFEIPKADGGTRKIQAPTEKLKLLQRRVATLLYDYREELEEAQSKRPVSHGFRRGLSIITNARRHRGRRYVLNFDLKDFFPSLNFGRVRGFFMKGADFKLHPEVATVIAQISCFDNSLPQGSPCSPVIADLVAQVLDLRLLKLAKVHGITYSRYADDITLSTNNKNFPQDVATTDGSAKWILGPGILSALAASGFEESPGKTRMQFNTSRQTVTGLVVNRKVNVAREYYMTVRAMCRTYLDTGSYVSGGDKVDNPQILEGMIAHITHVSRSELLPPTEVTSKATPRTALEHLHFQFLTYTRFVRQTRPLIVCEGKTDDIYLRYAIRYSTAFHPKLGQMNAEKFSLNVDFFRYGGTVQRVMGLHGGSASLVHFLGDGHRKVTKTFQNRPFSSAVIILLDSDEGLAGPAKAIKKVHGISIDPSADTPFYHLYDNVYVVVTPIQKGKDTSRIEDCFDAQTLATELEGKKFNPDKEHEAPGEYGKYAFAENVVRKGAPNIDFSGFAEVLNRIASVVDSYKPPAATKKA